MRIERLISMIMILLRKEMVSTKEFAEIFGVSTRTVLRDVEALSLANIPIYAQRGRNGGIGLLPNYKVDKKLLTAKDIQNLLVALKGVDQLIESTEIKATITKIKAMQEDQPNSDTLSIQYGNWLGTAELKDLANRLNQAISEHRYVDFDYFDRKGLPSRRTVEPYHLLYKGSRWYLQAFSLERQDFRTFRLSRMADIQIKKETFEPRSFEPKPMGLPTDLYPEFAKVTLQADHLIRDVMIERFGAAEITPINENSFLIDLRLPKTENAFRFILSLGKHAKIIKSEGTFLTEFQDYLQDLTQLYNK